MEQTSYYYLASKRSVCGHMYCLDDWRRYIFNVGMVVWIVHCLDSVYWSADRHAIRPM